MINPNGQAELETKDLTFSAKLEALIEGVANLTEQVAQLIVQQEEIVEKLVNIGLPGVDFEVYEDN